MKTILTIRNKLIGSAAALAVMALISLSTTDAAQLKGAEVLLKLGRGDRAAATAPAAITAEKVGMKCANCKDHYVSVAQPPEKMGRKVIATILRHDCATCETKIVVTGHGKGKKESVVHTCKESGVNSSGCALVKN